ncbi:hypothetical protein LJC59_00030 [Desulfovibrio sp. OttesenSCG-928-A18]|nr:hypothetical protein [Desulfovibrio sp. OttesenSCG-928-A18]
MPLASVSSRMAELGVHPFSPAKTGRGHHVLYDADEISLALKNEREMQLAKRQKRQPRIRRKLLASDNIYNMPWSKAKALLTAGGLEQ